MDALSLIVGVVGGALGAFSILVTWKLYQAGSNVNLEAIKVLGEIRASSHTTEVTSTRYTERVVGALIDLVGRDMRSSLTVGRAALAERIDVALEAELRDVDVQIATRLRTKVHSELTSAFRAIEFQTATLPKLPDTESSKASEASDAPRTVVTPGVPRLLRWIADHEGKYPFFSVKFLREKLFASDLTAQEALQFAIDAGILETYQVRNPKNPSWPVTACRLNGSHPVVREILRERGDDRSGGPA